MLAVPVKGDDGGPCTAAVAAPTPGRGPVLRATPRLRAVQLQHRVTACPPGPAPRPHLEAVVIPLWLHAVAVVALVALVVLMLLAIEPRAW